MSSTNKNLDFLRIGRFHGFSNTQCLKIFAAAETVGDTASRIALLKQLPFVDQAALSSGIVPAILNTLQVDRRHVIGFLSSVKS